MLKTLQCFAIALVVCASAHAADTVLFSMRLKKSVSETGIQTGTTEFRELERTATTSLLEVAMTPARPSPDLGDLMIGMCGLMKFRGEHYFRWELRSEEPFRFEVSFPKGAPESEQEFVATTSQRQCDLLLKR